MRFWLGGMLGVWLGCSCLLSHAIAANTAPSKKVQKPATATTKPTVRIHRIVTGSMKRLRGFFQARSHALPWLSAHRGGPTVGYPENALETFQHTLSVFYSLIECDVQESKDGRLFLLHDSRLRRTTTGKGYAYKTPWNKLKSFRLKDRHGKVTPYRIPLLTKVLKWARGKTILFLDVKNQYWRERSARSKAYEKRMFTRVVKAVQKAKAQSHVVIITYNLRQARLVHQLDSQLMISASLRSLSRIREYLRWIPASRLVAFAGVAGRRLKKAVFRRLLQEGIPSLVGMFRVEPYLNRLPLTKKGRGEVFHAVFKDFWKQGANGFATDHIKQAARALRPLYLKAQRLSSPYTFGWHLYYR